MNVYSEGQQSIKNLTLAPQSDAYIDSHTPPKPGESVSYAVINDQGIPVNYTTTLK